MINRTCARHVDKNFQKIVLLGNQFLTYLRFLKYQKNLEISEDLKGSLKQDDYFLEKSASCRKVSL